MPTSSEEEPESSIAIAMQQLFWKLQYSPRTVGTKALTKSFGWSDADAFDQHDVQELNRILCERLEEKMKGSSVEKQLQYLFGGHTYNYVRCMHVDFESTREETFMDLQLDVKGCRDVRESFLKYCEVETLEGDNKYHSDKFGLQDARKGVLFKDFPPVLQLHLKRFEYDFMRDMVVKYNGRYEFPETLDLDFESRRIMSPNSDPRVRNLYKLHSVLVHTGSGHGGHYFSFVRPDGRQWIKVDDEKVTKEKRDRAIGDQFGEDSEGPGRGYGGTFRVAKTSNAYMLVYIRESVRWRALEAGGAGPSDRLSLFARLSCCRTGPR